MKNRLFLWMAVLAITFSSVLSSCKKDDDNSAKPEPAKPTINLKNGKVVEIPTGLANSQDANAQTVASQLNSINQSVQYFTMLTPPDNAVATKLKVGGAVWAWTDGQNSVWLTQQETADKYIWDYDIKTTGISRYTFLHAEQYKDGSKGLMKIFVPGTQTESLNYEWNYDASKNFKFVATYSGLESLKYEAMVNADNSGYLKYYLGSALFYDVVWTKDGHGTWKILTGSTVSFSGSWK